MMEGDGFRTGLERFPPGAMTRRIGLEAGFARQGAFKAPLRQQMKSASSSIKTAAVPRQRAGCPRHVRIVLSGPESSGKSTLAAELATHFELPMAAEYARFHLEAGKPYPNTLDELAELARQHLVWQRALVPDDAPWGIFDTDLLNYWVWAGVAFGRVPEEIEQWLAAESHHIHLLCKADLPWRADPLREFPDLARRQDLFCRYQEELERREIRYFVIDGEGEARFAMAEEAFHSIIRQGEGPESGGDR